MSPLPATRPLLLGLLLSAAVGLGCGGGEAAPEGNDRASAESAHRTDLRNRPAADDAAGWKRWLSASVQAPWQGSFTSTWEGETAQHGTFTRLSADRFLVRLETAMTRHSPEGHAAEQSIQVEIACDGEQLRILLPAVLGAGPTMATLPASRMGALEEVDPQGQASQFRPDALSPWHLLQRTLDYGNAVSAVRNDEQTQTLSLEVPAGTLARFPKDSAVEATIELATPGDLPRQMTLVSGSRRLVVTFAELAAIDAQQAAALDLVLPMPADAITLALGALVDAEAAAASAVPLDQLGY